MEESLLLLKQETMPLRREEDIVLARQAARAWARDAGFGLVDQTKIATAVSELARNTVRHGLGGEMHVEWLRRGVREGIRLSFEDRGPGIADIGLALTPGYSTIGSLGHGLSGARRLVDEFDIASRINEGTSISVTKWR